MLRFLLLAGAGYAAYRYYKKKEQRPLARPAVLTSRRRDAIEAASHG